jgi:hypothetical protein
MPGRDMEPGRDAAGQSHIEGRRVRCPGCTEPQRHECEGRRDAAGQPLCSCIQCWGADIRADLAMYTEPPVLAEAWAYIEQIRHRERLRTTWPARPRIQVCEAPGCGRTVASRRYGPKRRYCSTACKQRSYRRRVKDRERAAAWLGVDPSQVVTGKLAGQDTATGAARTATSAPGGAEAGERSPGLAERARAEHRQREAWAMFGVADLLDQPPDREGQPQGAPHEALSTEAGARQYVPGSDPLRRLTEPGASRPAKTD